MGSRTFRAMDEFNDMQINLNQSCANERFWLNLQNRYDLDVAEDAAGGEIKRIPRRAA